MVLLPCTISPQAHEVDASFPKQNFWDFYGPHFSCAIIPHLHTRCHLYEKKNSENNSRESKINPSHSMASTSSPSTPVHSPPPVQLRKLSSPLIGRVVPPQPLVVDSVVANASPPLPRRVNPGTTSPSKIEDVHYPYEMTFFVGLFWVFSHPNCYMTMVYI